MKEIIFVLYLLLIGGVVFAQYNPNCEVKISDLFVAEMDEDGNVEEFFELKLSCEPDTLSFNLFTRAGDTVFVSNEVFKWNATDLKPQIYLYTLYYQQNGKEFKKNGFVTKH
jgi:hypothetical protein